MLRKSLIAAAFVALGQKQLPQIKLMTKAEWGAKAAQSGN